MNVRVALALFAAAGCDSVFRLDRVETPDARDVRESVARWTFDEGTGLAVTDAVSPALDLEVDPSASITWAPSTLTVNAPSLIHTPGAATKLVDAAKASTAITLEAWVRPADVAVPGLPPGRVFTISAGPNLASNITLGQSTDRRWVLRLRTSMTSTDGSPQLETDPVIASPPQLSHVVAVNDGLYRVIYVDGVEHARDSLGGDHLSWDDRYVAAMANEIGGAGDERPWLGTYDRVEVFDRALDRDEIVARFLAGP